MTRPHVVIVGWSTRAIAESAARAGFTVTAIDAFADLDQHPAVKALSVPRRTHAPPTPHALARAALAIASDAVVYSSPFENHARAIAALGRGRALWGNSPATLHRVRDPSLVMRALHDRGVMVPNSPSPDGPPSLDSFSKTGPPRTYGFPPSPTGFGETGSANVPNDPNGLNDPNGPNHLNDPNAPNDPNDPNDWLVKPFSSGGGHGVRMWRPGSRVPKGHYLQRRVEGTPGSVVFVSAGGRAVVLGVSRQIVGDAAFGANGYRYCGSILSARGDGAFGDDGRLISGVVALAHAAAAAFDLTGINGADFIANGSAPVALEINPRWSASAELVERTLERPLFGIHADACTSGVLPPVGDVPGIAHGAMGKAIVFAKEDVIAHHTEPWLRDRDVRDIPRPGAHLRAGEPVCTVFAHARTAAQCYASLVERTARIYAALKA